jgi:hypothetical protein
LNRGWQVFEADGSVTLTRRSSVSRRPDGSLAVDDSVPDAVKQMLQQIDQAKNETGGTATGSVNSGPSEPSLADPAPELEGSTVPVVQMRGCCA